MNSSLSCQRVRNCRTRSLPPAQACGIASTMSASGYQWGPKAGPLFHVRAAPRMLTARPITPPTSACSMGRLGREPRDDVAAQDAVDSAIARRKQEDSVETNHRRSPGREDMDSVKHGVCHESDHDAHDHAGYHSSNAPA